MKSRTGDLVVAGVLFGSLWGFSDVVLGAAIRSVALTMRGTVLTGIGVGVLFAAYAYTRTPWVVGLAFLTTILAKIVFQPAFGPGLAVLNSATAVLLEGAAVMAAIYILRARSRSGPRSRGVAAWAATMCSGAAFYAIGMNLAPCAYLQSFSPGGFLLRETLAWSLLAALTAPLGYAVGLRAAARVPAAGAPRALPLQALGGIAACWLACAITVWFTS